MIKKYSKLIPTPYDSGWLSPDGTFYRLRANETHWELADRIIQEKGIEPLGSGQETLLLNDWIRVAGKSIDVPVISFEFAGNIDKIKAILKQTYPTYYGKVFVDKDSPTNLDQRVYFEGTMDDFMQWSGTRSVVSSRKTLRNRNKMRINLLKFRK